MPGSRNPSASAAGGRAGMTALAVVLLLLFHTGAQAAKAPSSPVLLDQPDGSRLLKLPDDLENTLLAQFPGYRIPKDSEYNPDMVQYYYSRLIGVHPAVAFGDFNGDGKRDYALLLITQDTKWGPLVELVILNGRKKNGGEFDFHRIAEVYNFKDDYMSFQGQKLTKGRFKKGGWYLNWDKKKNAYVNLKS